MSNIYDIILYYFSKLYCYKLVLITSPLYFPIFIKKYINFINLISFWGFETIINRKKI